MAAGCISRERMAAFLAGDFLPADEAVTATHLQTCTDCNALAQELSDDPHARALLADQQTRAEPPAVESSLIELKGRLTALAFYGDFPAAEQQMLATVTDGDTHPGDLAPRAVAAPRRLGKFEIVRELGSGGFGVVYLAKDTVLDRCVALKLPRSSLLADPDARRRFYHEAQTLARLDHPHII